MLFFKCFVSGVAPYLILGWNMIVDRIAMGWIAIFLSRTEAKLLQKQSTGKYSLQTSDEKENLFMAFVDRAFAKCVPSLPRFYVTPCHLPLPSYQSVTNLSLMTTKTFSTVTIFELLNEFII